MRPFGALGSFGRRRFDVLRRVAVLVSGGGTNLQALIDAAAQDKLPHARLSLVIASRPGVFALERARQAGLPAQIISAKDYATPGDFDAALLAALQSNAIDVVVLAGYLTILGPAVLGAYENRILNIHPSLIPAFCGPGFYGLRPHREALARGVKITGATAHLVNEITDGGRILLQKAVEVQDGDTPEILQQRVMVQAEHVILPQALEMLCKDSFD